MQKRAVALHDGRQDAEMKSAIREEALDSTNLDRSRRCRRYFLAGENAALRIPTDHASSAHTDTEGSTHTPAGITLSCGVGLLRDVERWLSYVVVHSTHAFIDQPAGTPQAEDYFQSWVIQLSTWEHPVLQ